MPGEGVTFTAKVTSNRGTPTGAVKFMDGSKVLGSGILTGSPAIGTFTTSALSAGIHSVKAVYGGDANCAYSASEVSIQSVNALPTVGILSPAKKTTAPGIVQTFYAVYGDADGFANLKTVNLLTGLETGMPAILTGYDQTEDKFLFFDDTGALSAGDRSTVRQYTYSFVLSDQLLSI